jgi:hypothetical protein
MSPTRLHPMSLGAGLVFLALAGGCGEVSLPPANAPNGLPREGIGPDTIGVVRLDLTRLDAAGLGRWLRVPDPSDPSSGDTAARKALLLREDLVKLGMIAIVVPIPTMIPDEIGLYLAGPRGIDRELVEDAFLRAGGLNLAGAASTSLFAKELEDGWYFYGLGTDGVRDDADGGRARELATELAAAPPAIANAVLLADGSDWITPEMIPTGEARNLRRIRALCEAARTMRVILVSGGGDAEIEWRIGFRSASDAEAAADAVRKVLKDVRLMAEGSAAVGEIDGYDLLGWQRFTEGSLIEARGNSISIRPVDD